MKNKYSLKSARNRGSKQLEQVYALKKQVATDLTSRFDGLLDQRTIWQVVNEADALAATTPFPALVLPTLAEEKVRGAADWQRRQQCVFHRSLAVAA